MPDQVLGEGGREIPIGVPGTIVFNRMREDHERASRVYRLAGFVALGVGLALLAAGLAFGSKIGLWLVVLGGMTAACSVFPFNEALERTERADGINVLREEWITAGTDPALAPRRSEILDLILSLYVTKKNG